ncbi:hypothetical protein NE237_028353 [Protea cynaroides]|uniref:Uncharacterized protein n=1 Tax=Protea cynaroides TaxID=273540 RepID=A0A9Q0GR07_9MAGN|nr:hypothetical protein NE237_028353 [Protea cynaroides]
MHEDDVDVVPNQPNVVVSDTNFVPVVVSKTMQAAHVSAGCWADAVDDVDEDVEEGELQNSVPIPVGQDNNVVDGVAHNEASMQTSLGVLGGSVHTTIPGRVDVVFKDIMVVDEAISSKGGDFTAIEKCHPLGRNGGRGKKAIDSSTAVEARKSRLESLR